MNYVELLHRCAAAAWDKQIHLGDLIKDEPRWNTDLAQGLLLFGAQQFRVQVLGSESAITKTWLWAWGNAGTTLPEVLLLASRQVKMYGEQRGIHELRSPYHDLTPNLNGHTLSMIASVICDGNAYYRAPYDGGAVFLLLRDPEYPPQRYEPVARIPMIFTQMLQSVPLRNHRLAFYSYLDYYQAEIDNAPDALTGSFRDGGRLRATFDAIGRLKGIETVL